MNVRALTLVCAIAASGGAASAQSVEPVPAPIVVPALPDLAMFALAAQNPQPGPPQGQGQRRAQPAPPGQPGQPGQPQPGPGDGREGGPQGPPPNPAPQGGGGPLPRVRLENQTTNVRVEVTITDERGGTAPTKKSVAIVTSDGVNGSVRSSTSYTLGPGNAPGNAPFNVDIWPIIMTDSKIHLRLIVQYDAPMVVERAPNTTGGVPAPILNPFATYGGVRDSVTVVVDNGKPLQVIQSTDPVSDRKVSVEVKATILR